MKNIFTAFLTLLCSASLISCSMMSSQNVDVTTTQGGDQALATGSRANAVIGGSLGKNMDDSDRSKIFQALEENPAGQPTSWRNSGTDYTVIPTRNVSVGDNQYCREYRTTATVSGQTQQMYGTACRRPDGTWKSVN